MRKFLKSTLLASALVAASSLVVVNSASASPRGYSNYSSYSSPHGTYRSYRRGSRVHNRRRIRHGYRSSYRHGARYSYRRGYRDGRRRGHGRFFGLHLF